MARFNKRESANKQNNEKHRAVLIICGLMLAVISAVNIAFVFDIFERPQTNVSDTDVPPAPTVVQNWKGWQKGTVGGAGAQLISALDSSVICTLEAGSEVIVLERNGDKLYCRAGLDFGFLGAGDILLVGEPTLVETPAQTEPQELSGEHKEALDAIFDDYRCVGANVAVIRGGTVTDVYAYGWCDPYLKTECDTDTKFRIASISKVVVAASAAVLAEQGVVDLDGDVSSYIGMQMRNPYCPDEIITLRQLLTHTSTLDAFSVSGTGKQQLYAWLNERGIWRKRLTPGTAEAWRYSNGGIGIAAAALELASDLTLVDFTNRYFFEPLGADASFIGKFIEEQDNIAPCYKGSEMVQGVSYLINKPYSETPGDNFAFYAGGLIISAKDLAKFACILANDGYYNGVYYMSPETVEMLETAHFDTDSFTQCVTLRYCEDMICGRDLYYHPGNSTGVVSFMCYDPETGDGVAVIANGSRRRDQYENGLSKLCEEVAGYCFDNLCA